MDNLQAQYDEVTAYLNEYQRFIEDIKRRLVERMVKSPREYFKFGMRSLKSAWRYDPLSEKTQDSVKNVALALATEEDKQNPFFGVVTSDYPTDALSDALTARFPGYRFDKIKKLHDSKQARLGRFNARQVLGVIMAASALLLKSIPKTVLESWGWDYAEFETTVFWVTVSVAGYVGAVFLPISIIHGLAKDRSRFVGEILEYAVLKNG